MRSTEFAMMLAGDRRDADIMNDLETVRSAFPDDPRFFERATCGMSMHEALEVTRGTAPAWALYAAEELQAIAQAREIYVVPSDNKIEIDEVPATSSGEDGVWVAAWVIVPSNKLGSAL